MVTKLNDLKFDTIVVNKGVMDTIKSAHEIAGLDAQIFPPGIRVISSEYIPENMVAVRQGDKFVAIVNIGGKNE